jgi:hypothetical protein
MPMFIGVLFLCGEMLLVKSIEAHLDWIAIGAIFPAIASVHCVCNQKKPRHKKKGAFRSIRGSFHAASHDQFAKKEGMHAHTLQRHCGVRVLARSYRKGGTYPSKTPLRRSEMDATTWKENWAI